MTKHRVMCCLCGDMGSLSIIIYLFVSCAYAIDVLFYYIRGFILDTFASL